MPDNRRVLEVDSVQAGYDLLQVLWDVSLHVDEGEFVALLGPNGAGKTTTLRTIAGFLTPTDGEISFQGRAIAGAAAHLVSRMGLGYVSESLNLFPAMTVHENLQVGANAVRDKAKVSETNELVFELFPRLRERRQQRAGTLSGGEQQMLAIGRALMSAPKVLLLDEPSMGLSPILVEQIFDIVVNINQQGTTVLLVEQNALMALNVAKRGYILQTGEIVLTGDAARLRADPAVRKAYLGED